MALDAYLKREFYISDWKYDKTNNPVTGERGKNVIIVRAHPGIDARNVAWIVEQSAYWSKCSQIHRWFNEEREDDLESGQRMDVDHELLKKLLSVVELVLDNHLLARNTLPVDPRFGPSAYDKAYFEDLEYTQKVLSEALERDDGELYYEADW
jgi:hypothetical protein